MAQKLKDEGYLQAFPESFFVPTEENYYARNVSAYTRDTFIAEADLTGYMAGYMWGTTGFVYNPYEIGTSPEQAREIMKSWHCLSAQECNRKITAKDNVRDTYFVGLGMYHENRLLDLKNQYKNNQITFAKYQEEISKLMNDTSPQTISGVQALLEKMRGNLYGLETDEGKLDIITGRFDVSYQWSGDAVYVLDMAEDAEISSTPQELEYCIPEASSNLWFDGWVMMKDSKMTEEAMAFINYVSRPDNVVRNMYYIGYTSCIAGEEVFEYLSDPEIYGAGEEESAPYDLSYFFGDNHILYAYKDQVEKQRQLFAQYPTPDALERLVVMKYFDKSTNEKINRMWNMIK
jgi:spermidine/putrescine transport system substrate-binding protein